jgi:hypothetical protein
MVKDLKEEDQKRALDLFYCTLLFELVAAWYRKREIIKGKRSKEVVLSQKLQHSISLFLTS